MLRLRRRLMCFRMCFRTCFQMCFRMCFLLGHLSPSYLVRLLVRRCSTRRLSVPRFSVPRHLMNVAAHVQMVIVAVMAKQRQSQMKRPYLDCKCR